MGGDGGDSSGALERGDGACGASTYSVASEVSDKIDDDTEAREEGDAA